MPDETTHYTIRWGVPPDSAALMGTEELRENFLIESLFEADQVHLTYTHYDRMIVGGAMPAAGPLALEVIPPLGTASFLERRELLVVNVGGPGAVIVDDEPHAVANRDMVYVGMGKTVSFVSDASDAPAKFYLLSAPAHAAHPTRVLQIAEAKQVHLGDSSTCNKRTIFQFIHPQSGVKTCQLVAGITMFEPGSVWNTMPCHVHDRRMEAYLYFDLPADARVFHMMGEPDETRHLLVGNEQAILSPPWSIHSGVGTASYAFVWGMAGDNIDYTDMDPIAIADLR